jgi:hypothetical protein
VTTATRRIAEGPPRGRLAVTLLPPGTDGRQPGEPRGGTQRGIGHSPCQRGRSGERVRDIDWVQHRGSCEAFQHDTGRVVDPVAARAAGPGLRFRGATHRRIVRQASGPLSLAWCRIGRCPDSPVRQRGGSAPRLGA